MLRLWEIHYTDGDHEPEVALFVHTDTPRPSTTDGRAYLLSIDGLIGRPEELAVHGVYLFDTATDINGDPYLITVEE